jgi:hypothetical protein
MKETTPMQDLLQSLENSQEVLKSEKFKSFDSRFTEFGVGILESVKLIVKQHFIILEKKSLMKEYDRGVSDGKSKDSNRY